MYYTMCTYKILKQILKKRNVVIVKKRKIKTKQIVRSPRKWKTLRC